MEQSFGEYPDIFGVLRMQGFQKLARLLFIILPIFWLLLPGFEQGVAAFFGGKLGVVYPHTGFLEEIGIVDDWVSTVKRIVIKIVLLVLPMVTHHGVEREIGHAIAEDKSWLIRSLFILCKLEMGGEMEKGGLIFHVEGIHHHHG